VPTSKRSSTIESRLILLDGGLAMSNETHPRTVTIEVDPPPVFIKIADAVKKYSTSRSKLLLLVDSGEIDGFRPRLKGARKGMLLLDDASIDRWIRTYPAATQQTDQPPTLNSL
jgi:hypothetical protein